MIPQIPTYKRSPGNGCVDQLVGLERSGSVHLGTRASRTVVPNMHEEQQHQGNSVASGPTTTSPTSNTQQSPVRRQQSLEERMYLSGVASPPSLENCMMRRHSIPYALACELAAEARIKQQVGEPRDVCTDDDNLRCDDEAEDDKRGSTLESTNLVGGQDGTPVSNDKESASSPMSEPHHATCEASISSNQSASSASHNANATDSLNCEQDHLSIAQSDDDDDAKQAGGAVSSRTGSHHEAAVFLSDFKGRPSSVNTATTTHTGLSGDQIPSVIYIRRWCTVPNHEPLELPLGVPSIKKQFLKRLRNPLRRSNDSERLSELDNEVFEHTLVQI